MLIRFKFFGLCFVNLRMVYKDILVMLFYCGFNSYDLIGKLVMKISIVLIFLNFFVLEIIID